MSYVLDELVRAGIGEIVFVVGYLREAIQEYIAEEYPGLDAQYVVQAEQDGTAGAVKLAEPYVDDELLVLFVDTLFDADLSLIRRLDDDVDGVLWAKEVEDYGRYGVIVTREDGTMERIVEKPSTPISRLANIGLYFIRDYELLFEGINHTLRGDAGVGGEFYLTDAFQYMVDRGARLLTAPVVGWYDCGKPETLLETNRHLLETSRGGVSDRACVAGTHIAEPVRIEEDVVLVGGSVGPNVTLERGSRILQSHLRDTIVGRGAVLENAELYDSLVGAEATVKSFRGSLSVTDHSSVAAVGGPL